MSMQIDERVSLGNIITIMVLVVSIVTSWTMMGSSIESINEEQDQINTRLDLKSDKTVVELKFQFIQEDLSEIKEMIKEMM